MATAEIGSLRVSLSMESASFSKGADDASRKIKKLEQDFSFSSAAISKAIKAAGAAAAGAFSVAAIKGALDFADSMGKAAQSAGLSVESFSALAHVADLAGISHEEFSAQIAKLNKNLRDSREFATDTGLALSAMGISARSAAGEVRSIDEIIGDVAEKFAGYSDGLNKVNLAQDLFGKNGARLIPFLNQGREGIHALTDEAEKLGIVITEAGAKKAEAFNDALTKLGAVGRGFALDISQIIAPPLTWLVDKLIEGQKAAKDFQTEFRKQQDADIAAAKAKALGEALAGNTAELAKYRAELARLEALPRPTSRDIKDMETLRTVIQGVLEARANLQAQPEIPAFTTTTNAPSGKELEIELEKQWKDAVDASTVAIKINQERVQEYAAAIADTIQPMEEMIQKQQELARARQIYGADQNKLANIEQMSQAKTANSYAGAGAAIAGSLSQLFKKSKALAIGAAIMNTAQAITAALKNPPGPPFSYAYAAAAAISGAAQIAAIRSASESGSGSVPAVSGGGGTVDTGSDAGATPAQQQPRTLYIEGGFSASSLFSGPMVRELIERINAEARDGAVIVVK